MRKTTLMTVAAFVFLLGACGEPGDGFTISTQSYLGQASAQEPYAQAAELNYTWTVACADGTEGCRYDLKMMGWIHNPTDEDRVVDVRCLLRDAMTMVADETRYQVPINAWTSMKFYFLYEYDTDVGPDTVYFLGGCALADHEGFEPEY
jgi:hypothetical protein